MPLVQELGATLREWAQIWHKLFVVRASRRPLVLVFDPARHTCDNVSFSVWQANRTALFRGVQQMAYSLIEYRSQIVSGTLPKDDLVELKKKVTAKIDYGNRYASSWRCSETKSTVKFDLLELRSVCVNSQDSGFGPGGARRSREHSGSRPDQHGQPVPSSRDGIPQRGRPDPGREGTASDRSVRVSYSSFSV